MNISTIILIFAIGPFILIGILVICAGYAVAFLYIRELFRILFRKKRKGGE